MTPMDAILERDESSKNYELPTDKSTHFDNTALEIDILIYSDR